MSSTPPEDSESFPATQVQETQVEECEEPYSPSPERPQPWAQIIFKNGREPQELLANPPNEDRGGGVPKDEYQIGRHPSNTVTVQDPRVSTRHCCISRTEKEIVPGSNLSQSQVTLQDLSTNGTWVNGQRLKKHESRLLNSGAGPTPSPSHGPPAWISPPPVSLPGEPSAPIDSRIQEPAARLGRAVIGSKSLLHVSAAR
ncbi:hypothetical protein CYMTET_36251 [Cymbomonas tetramitiformis]|uniref:FHA domain-containing protein n=1 Tax=Cymbomonas tetramitiformis TaxID=36881 RepID=A0AAE0CGA7_9CHLO|nr:hypothetical protein CYMTET_36251 [Cymbomonas tetramitiformis]